MCRSTCPPGASPWCTSEWCTVPFARSNSGRRVSPAECPANGPSSAAASPSLPARCTLALGGSELGRRRRGIGEWRGERRLLDRVELCDHVGFQRVQLWGRDAVLDQPRPRDDQRVALAPAVELALGTVLAGVA